MSIHIVTREGGEPTQVHLRTSEDQVSRFLRKLPKGKGPQRILLMPKGVSGKMVPVTIYEASTDTVYWNHKTGAQDV